LLVATIHSGKVIKKEGGKENVPYTFTHAVAMVAHVLVTALKSGTTTLYNHSANLRIIVLAYMEVDEDIL